MKLVPCEDCQSSGWEDKIQRPMVGPFPWPECGYCKNCNGRGWANSATRNKEQALSEGLRQGIRDRDIYIEELKATIRILIENEPDDPISDGGHVVLDLWRHDAKKVLTKNIYN